MRVSWIFALLCLVIVVAVFAWGTAYKMSLYHDDCQCLTHAKMGTTAEGPMRGMAVAALMMAVIPWLAALMRPQPVLRVVLSRITPPRPVSIPKQPQLFFRPPPSYLR
ncbi:hypothetical protein [Terriglobus tenax]|uniref:hypothetical protein n=1 Tax=Terriglobus tenax TaxID=1111115 RepID=UPI0021E0D903|nr:hypothetical protein [Terriglobus tenax]